MTCNGKFITPNANTFTHVKLTITLDILSLDSQIPPKYRTYRICDMYFLETIVMISTQTLISFIHVSQHV